MANSPGYLYVLYNPSLEGFVKIGRTTKDPEERAEELSSATGVATKFVVVYKAYFIDCISAESFVHTLLKDKRLSEGKEFFSSSITEAIQAILKAEEFFINSSTDNRGSEDDTKSDTASPKSMVQGEELWQDIMDAADSHYNGFGDTLEDHGEALKLYKQAAKLGSIRAFHQIGYMYQYGEGVNIDVKLALHYYKEAANRGDDICWGDMAICYYELKEYGNSDKCWVKLFTSPSMKGKEDDLGMYFFEFIKYMYCESWYSHNSSLKSFYRDMIKGKTEEELKYLVFGSK
jgi:hypothetical protein